VVSEDFVDQALHAKIDPSIFNIDDKPKVVTAQAAPKNVEA
jgi:hypothetical protein